jgi:hypothetical protein
LNIRQNWLALTGDSRLIRNWLGCWCRGDGDYARLPHVRHGLPRNAPPQINRGLSPNNDAAGMYDMQDVLGL